MVTAVVLLVLCVPSIPAAAATKAGAWPPAPWTALFGDTRPRKPRRPVLAVPLPKPRPAEAPTGAESKAAETKAAETKAAETRAAEAKAAETKAVAARAAEGKAAETKAAETKAAETKAAQSGKPEAKSEPSKPESDKPEMPAAAATDKAAAAPPAPPPPSACRLALTEAVAIAPSIPDIKGVGGCGGEDLVRLEAVVLPDKRRVTVKPAAILRCGMATAVAEWIRTDMAALAESLGSTISDLDNFDSFQCRGRNRVVGARLSEHGRANALDIRAIKLANGRAISFTDRAVARETRESVLQSMCARFPTVLGPGSDWYHEDHIHIDLAERRNNYKICQWNVWDPMPQIAPLLPAVRPEEAPPREVAAKPEQGKSEPGKSEPSKSEPGKSERGKSEQGKSGQGKPDAAKSAAPQARGAKATRPDATATVPATKKRREDRRF